MQSDATVCVIGAGAAGLASAQRLAEHGIDVIVLEARDRLGGRIWTMHPAALSVPVELGAEFLHGETPELDRIVREAGLRAIDVAGRRWSSTRGRLRLMDDFWERLDRVMRRLDEERDPDRSFADAVERMRSVPASDRRLATQYVEGFHAADRGRISERSLAEGGSPRDDVRERRIGRLAEGYDSIITALATPTLDRIRLGAMVTRVSWGKERVAIEFGAPGERTRQTVEARAVVVAVPLGVLQAPHGTPGAVMFEPELPEKRRAASNLEMGMVARVVLQLDEPFWSTKSFAKHAGDDRFDTMSFLHSNAEVAFPVWWTPYPVRAPMLVGWRGGPGALTVAGLTRDEIVSAAVDSLATLLALSKRAIRRHIVAAFTHDWINDPFSRGAYSYTAVGGDDASARIARPVAGTLFFAGEHADREGRNGTVHGAIASGWDAADAVMRAL